MPISQKDLTRRTIIDDFLTPSYVKKKFDSWKKSTTSKIEKAYKEGIQILGNDVIVEMWVLIPEVEDLSIKTRSLTLTDEEGRNISIVERTLMTSIGRVLAKGKDCTRLAHVDVGAYVTVADTFTLIEINKRWLEWQHMLSVQQPPPQGAEPPMLLGQFIEWQNKKAFTEDKLTPPSFSEVMTFQLEEFFVKTVVTEEWILQNSGSEIFSTRKNGKPSSPEPSTKKKSGIIGVNN